MAYLKLFHGRKQPNQQMDDWGFDGPVFGPLKFVHTTYGCHIKFNEEDQDGCELFIDEDSDMIRYDGDYYGDWSVFDNDLMGEDERLRLTVWDEVKARQ